MSKVLKKTFLNAQTSSGDSTPSFQTSKNLVNGRFASVFMKQTTSVRAYWRGTYACTLHTCDSIQIKLLLSTDRSSTCNSVPSYYLGSIGFVPEGRSSGELWGLEHPPGLDDKPEG